MSEQILGDAPPRLTPPPLLEQPTAPPTPPAITLDGDAPRLGSSAPIFAAPSESHPMPQTSAQPSIPPAGAQTAGPPLVSPVLNSPTAPMLPNVQSTPPALPDASPTLPSLSATASTSMTTESDGSAEPVHPMAHLMPTREAGPSEASRRAAEQRAIRKAKAKKNKIRTIIVAVILTAVVGPPLGRWLVNAINEAGNTATVEEPAE